MSSHDNGHKDDENTEVLSQGDEIQCTGSKLSETSPDLTKAEDEDDENTEFLSQGDEIQCTGSTLSETSQDLTKAEDIDCTQIVSPEGDIACIAYTGRTCSEMVNEEVKDKKPIPNFDPDETFIDSNLLEVAKKTNGCFETHDDPKPAVSESEVPGEVSNLSLSQQSTQPVIPSQDLQCSPSLNDTKYLSDDDKEDSIPKTYSRAPTKVCNSESSSLSISSRNELQSSLSSAVASSSSSSQVVSSASSSKRVESDDSPGSQDIFASQGSFRSSPNSGLTVSQLLPTLQFSGDVPTSQSYEGFVPRRICPTSPTDGLTSTPLRHLKHSPSSEALKEDVISISDEEFSFEEPQKFGEKRKLSDSSVESKAETKNKAKRHCDDARQSIELVQHFNSSRRPLSVSDPEDLALDSQAFCLQLSETDPEVTESQTTEISNSLNKDNSWKSHSGSLKEVHSNPCSLVGLSTQDGNSKFDEHRNTNHDISIVQIDDVEDDIELVSPPPVKTTPVGEITLDSSGPYLNTSADIEVLSPYGTSAHSKEGRATNAGNVMQKNVSSQYNVESSPYRQNLKNSSSISDQQKVKQSTSQLHSTNEKEHLVHDLDSSKENLHPDEHEFEMEAIYTYTCTFKMVSKTVMDMNKKEAVKNTVPVLEILDSKFISKRDSSPSAVEDSSSVVTGGSPGSIASGPGPFPLIQPPHMMRMSMFSTTSSSSTGSSASAWHRQVPRRGRIPAAPLYHSQDPPANHHGPVSWSDLMQQHNIHSDLYALGESHLEQWACSLLNNSSSDDNKTIGDGDKGLDTVVEDDDEDVLGVPLGVPPIGGKKPNVGRRKRNNSSTTNTTTPVSIPKESLKNDDVSKNGSECSNSPSTTKKRRGRPFKAISSSKTTPSGSAKKKAPTPKKKDPVLPVSGDPSSTRDDSVQSSESEILAPGCPVFAFWKSFYYPAVIENLAKPTQYYVVFHDSKLHMRKLLSRNFIYPISTFQIGQTLLARSEEDGEYMVAEVVAVTPLVGEQGDEHYTVKLEESGDCITVKRSELALTEKQAKQCSGEDIATTSCSSSPSKRSSESKVFIDFDKNFIPGKRVRTPKQSNQINVNSPVRPGPSNTSRRLIEDSSSSSATEDEPLATALISGVQPEQVGNACWDPLARKGKGLKNSSSKKDDPEALKIYGPIPPNGSKIFAGYSFLITTTDVPPVHRKRDVESEVPASDLEDSSSEYGTDSECFQFSKAPMSKDRLAQQILSGGGKVIVISSWTDVPLKNIKNTYVVSNRPCLTATFIYCLVRGIRLVVHDHIINCCKENKQFKVDLGTHILPAGHSLLSNKWILWNELKNKSPLKGENIVVVGKNKAFKRFWENILSLAGASQSCDVTKYLSENPCSDSDLQQAKDLNVPIVSPTWVTQSLIHNKALPYEQNIAFRYNFEEKEYRMSDA